MAGENLLDQCRSGTRQADNKNWIGRCTPLARMFVYKLSAFMQTIKRDELAGFAFDPILIYGVVAMGFLCMLAWAFLSGQFKNIEGPKYEMMERFDEQERAEEKARREGKIA